MLYTLEELYTQTQFNNDVLNYLNTNGSPFLLGESVDTTFVNYLCASIYNYFYEDYVAYSGEDETEVNDIFINRLGYDIAIRYPYWKRRYAYLKALYDGTLDLLRTSKVDSSSSDKTDSVGGSLSKSASTPSGVTTTTTPDTITITRDDDSEEHSVDTDGFVDKYTNYQGKTATANNIVGERQGSIERTGSIKEGFDALDRMSYTLPDEIAKAVSKHFIFDYAREDLYIED